MQNTTFAIYLFTQLLHRSFDIAAVGALSKQFEVI